MSYRTSSLIVIVLVSGILFSLYVVFELSQGSIEQEYCLSYNHRVIRKLYDIERCSDVWGSFYDEESRGYRRSGPICLDILSELINNSYCYKDGRFYARSAYGTLYFYTLEETNYTYESDGDWSLVYGRCY